ncbi:MAG: hypothetical protein WB558_07265 [Terriglobales bacterium]
MAKAKQANQTSVAAATELPATEAPAPTAYSSHTPEALHAAILEAKKAFEAAQNESESHAHEQLLPALDEAIRRYKQPGKGVQYRMNDCPTVEAYFRSIGLIYGTVRSWKSRAQKRLLKAAIDAGTRPETVKPDFRRATTLDDHPTDEAVSALHKAIRRGDERQAAYWCKELDQAGFPGSAWNRILITASEDIGVAERGVAADVRALYENWRTFPGKADDATEEGSAKRLFLVHAAMVVCRARKSRMVDHLLNVTYHGKGKLEVPDHALDKHTSRGRSMKRGVDHFFAEGAHLENPAFKDDPYEQEAHGLLKSIEKERQENKGKKKDRTK